MKRFNTTAVCIPSKHYMVDLTDRVKEIKNYIDDGKYFTINRARQYGKTTTIVALCEYLSETYDVVSIDFQNITESDFFNENKFVKSLASVFCDGRDNMDMPVPNDYYDLFDSLAKQKEEASISNIFAIFDKWCKNNTKPIVLIIDEIDTASNNQVFLDFLGKFRACYLKKEKNPRYKTFQSVILSGVTDIKHMKERMPREDSEKENSPWNIAANFNIDMRLSQDGIKGMLEEYEKDNNIGMDVNAMAKLIRDYTNGYPFLVSRICELIDKVVVKKYKTLDKCWTRDGLDEAIKFILSEDNSLFKSMTTKLNNMPKMKAALRSILMEGTKLSWNPDQKDIVLLQMFGFIRNENNSVKIDNRIFETRLYYMNSCFMNLHKES